MDLTATNPVPFQIFFSFCCASIGLFLLFLGGSIASDAGSRRTEENENLSLIWFLAGSLFLFMALLPPAAWIADLINQNTETLIIELSKPRTVPISLILGVGLFWLREKRKFIYGILEVLVSILGVTAAVLAADSLLGKVTGLLSGIYVLVRGLDNIRQAPPIWLKWVRRMLPSRPLSLLWRRR